MIQIMSSLLVHTVILDELNGISSIHFDSKDVSCVMPSVLYLRIMQISCGWLE